MLHSQAASFRFAADGPMSATSVSSFTTSPAKCLSPAVLSFPSTYVSAARAQQDQRTTSATVAQRHH